MKKATLTFAIGVLIGTSLLAGCGGGGGSSGGGAGSSGSGSPVSTGVTNPTGTTVVPTNAPGVHLDSSTVVVPVGSSITLTALLDDSTGKPIAVPDANWQWSVDNSGVAKITPQGHILNITGNSVGSATVTAKESGSGQTASATVNVVAASNNGSTGGATNGGATSGGATSGGATTGGSTGGSTLPNIPGTIIYQSNFPSVIDGAWSQTSGMRMQTPSGRWFYGEFGKENPGASLTLTNIPAHSTVTVGFTLFIIRSMDGNETASGFGPDIWDLTVQGGPTVVYTTFSNNSTELLAGQGFPEGFTQSYPADFNAANPVQNSYWAGSAEHNSLGFNFYAKPADSVYQIVRTFPNTSGSLTLNFSSADTQPIADEAWGMEKVVVAYQ
jgi:hypothetical protein